MAQKRFKRKIEVIFVLWILVFDLEEDRQIEIVLKTKLYISYGAMEKMKNEIQTKLNEKLKTHELTDIDNIEMFLINEIKKHISDVDFPQFDVIR